ncbi:Hypothetical predicted protein [Octopus vulgaris]|uniref:Uncharacterized protein n=1 Tax=Octopus vulgaris TaxID=6645 RepID=A0AA36F9E9_OCTVU|nr:Hypothetical predicted protein [Octopus vulgaris]
MSKKPRLTEFMQKYDLQKGYGGVEKDNGLVDIEWDRFSFINLTSPYKKNILDYIGLILIMKSRGEVNRVEVYNSKDR